ncbi:hypothetical protein FB45DRAFT_912892 [Roridomyces roridus]|uniref:C3H1-type domain-containing protein n=1 Tax=Roridomyces roridus TaxID=1738132 RepID=A0AAD7BWD5_9AGAR|nr:hypothetical protein FB45DRAFT_912892 [Roridomyces roridus]
MSAQKSTVTKKYRCRYFEEDGRPIHPTCNQGVDCRFVHPSDAQWPGLKPFIDTRLLVNKSSSKKNREVSRIGPFNYSESRGPALVSQSDLFQRRKVEGDERSERSGRPAEPKMDRDRDRRRDNGSGDRAPRGHSRNRSLSPVRPRAHDVRKSQVEANKNKGAKQGADLTKRPETISKTPKDSVKVETMSSPLQNSKSTVSAPALRMPTSSLIPTSPKLSEEQARAEKLVKLFREIARVSNQAVQETAAHEKEGQKLQTYTDISSALSKISASASASVAPTLADIMLKHEQSKHRIEENFRALGGVWEQVFDVFVTEVVHAVDTGLQNAMATIKKEKEQAVKDIVAASGAGSLRHSTTNETHDKKRARTRGPMEKENEDSRSGRGASRDRDHKRRRFASRSSSPDSHDRRTSRHGDSSIEDILRKMKMKIDQQAESLQMLSKENSEVWSWFDHRDSV